MPESTPPSSLLERDALAAKYAAQQAEAWRRYKDILRPLQTLQPMLADLLDAPPRLGELAEEARHALDRIDAARPQLVELLSGLAKLTP
ncbi:MAG: hypothetical protein WCE40_08230 [Polyangia bacterium]